MMTLQQTVAVVALLINFIHRKIR